jgi:hypothetical protein
MTVQPAGISQTGSIGQTVVQPSGQQDMTMAYAQLFVLGFIAWIFWSVFVKEDNPKSPSGFGKER